MGVKMVRPNVAGRRKFSVDTFSDITKKEPEKSLVMMKKRTSGRGMSGSITVHHRGGGARRYLRIVDFHQDRFDVPARVQAIEYDPNRNARIALIQYEDGEKRYILAPVGLEVGNEILSSRESSIPLKPGNRLSLKHIPTGFLVNNVELFPGRGGSIVRSAGNTATILAQEKGFVHLKLPSGEVRKFPEMCMATIGQISNPDFRHIRWGKAGRMRWRGIRPTVRGKAKNPVDHPHGGGEGKHPIGLKAPKTPWGKLALGVNTRRKEKISDRYVVKSRKEK